MGCCAVAYYCSSFFGHKFIILNPYVSYYWYLNGVAMELARCESGDTAEVMVVDVDANGGK